MSERKQTALQPFSIALPLHGSTKSELKSSPHISFNVNRYQRGTKLVQITGGCDVSQSVLTASDLCVHLVDGHNATEVIVLRSDVPRDPDVATLHILTHERELMYQLAVEVKALTAQLASLSTSGSSV